MQNFTPGLLTVCSEMLPFSENIQNIKMFGVPPNTFAIGYTCTVHNKYFATAHGARLHSNKCHSNFQTTAGRIDGVF